MQRGGPTLEDCQLGILQRIVDLSRKADQKNLRKVCFQCQLTVTRPGTNVRIIGVPNWSERLKLVWIKTGVRSISRGGRLQDDCSGAQEPRRFSWELHASSIAGCEMGIQNSLSRSGRSHRICMRTASFSSCLNKLAALHAAWQCQGASFPVLFPSTTATG